MATDDQGALDTIFIAEVHDRLKDRKIVGAVSDVLKCIKSAIEDSRSLKRRYRLQETDTVYYSESREITPRTTSKSTLERSNSTSRSPLNASIKLAIVDEKLFPALVEDLCGFDAADGYGGAGEAD